MSASFSTPDGFRLLSGYFDRPAQEALVASIMTILKTAPIYQPVMPRSGRALSVKMSNCGALGWISEKAGYRYGATHPETGQPWPPIPEVLLDLWRAQSDWPDLPEACLINHYDEKARLGLHIDADESATYAPVLSVSLGDSAYFRLGGPSRKGPTQRLTLHSGDVVILGGASRRFYHGVDKILPGTSSLLPESFRPGRINLTLRRVHQ
ncbi:alpha-ketoglutarate-dependent dioxygenase AlkB [Woodsholea maritima]|uniref:alpha-ketoglutarate-dependent dioxygenase AlkB n=1 Tax=Woodsholea maritima TaxID=240237 RepID=UPI00036B7EF8|nr:alpha-ketoglutarate-dependent dioxygenase AlkB [Woodsholea maritima]